MSSDIQEIALTKCPDCKGKKRVFAHVNYGSAKPGEWKHIDCHRCCATGFIPTEQLAWIAAGRKLRDERLARDLSLREEAIRLGVPVVELSAIERGMRDPRTTSTVD